MEGYVGGGEMRMRFVAKWNRKKRHRELPFRVGRTLGFALHVVTHLRGDSPCYV